MKPFSPALALFAAVCLLTLIALLYFLVQRDMLAALVFGLVIVGWYAYDFRRKGQL